MAEEKKTQVTSLDEIPSSNTEKPELPAAQFISKIKSRIQTKLNSDKTLLKLLSELEDNSILFVEELDLDITDKAALAEVGKRLSQDLKQKIGELNESVAAVLRSSFQGIENYYNQFLPVTAHYPKQSSELADGKLGSTLEDIYQNLRERLWDEYKGKKNIKRLFYPTKPLMIDAIYVNLQIVKEEEQRIKEEKKIKAHPKHNVLIEITRDHDIHWYETIHTAKDPIKLKNLFQLFKVGEKKRLLVEGRAGIGKSTFCQYIAYCWAQSANVKKSLWQNEFDFVFWLPLRELEFTDDDIIQVLEKVCFRCGFNRFNEEDKNLINKAFKEKKILWLLDGYDELLIPEKSELKKLWQRLINEQNIILTSRPGYWKLESSWRRVEITGFNDKQIQKYIQRFYDSLDQEETLKAQNIKQLQQLMQTHNSLRGILHVPINLELLCSIYEQKKLNVAEDITFTQLYSKMVETLYERHATQKKEKNRVDITAITNISTHEDYTAVTVFLECLGFIGMEAREVILQKELLNLVAKELSQYEILKKVPADKLLKQAKDLGFIKACPDGKYESYYFLHLTFQEYFAAKYIVNCLINNINPSNYQNIDDLIHQKKFFPQYEIVWWFVSGLLSVDQNKLEKFFKLLCEEPKDLIGLSSQLLKMHCLEECRGKLNDKFKREILTQAVYWIKYEIAKKEEYNLYYFYDYLIMRPRAFEEELIKNLFSECLEDRDKGLFENTIDFLKDNENIPFYILEKLVKLIDAQDAQDDEDDEDIISYVLNAFENQKKLPIELMPKINNLLELKDDVKVYYILGILEYQTDLPICIIKKISKILDNWFDDDVEFRAVNVLAKQKALSKDIVEQLFKFMKDPDMEARVRASTAAALANQPALPEKIIDELIQILVAKVEEGDDEDDDLKEYAITALKGQMGISNYAIQKLKDSLNNFVGVTNYWIVRVYDQDYQLPDEIIQKLANLFLNIEEEIDIRVAAGDALIKQQLFPEDLLEPLSKLLYDGDINIQGDAALMLGKQKNLPQNILVKVVELLNGKSKISIIFAILALSLQGHLTEEVMLKLNELLSANDSKFKFKIIRAISEVKNLSPEIIQSLFEIIKNPIEDKDIIQFAVIILSNQEHLDAKIIAELIDAIPAESLIVNKYTIIAILKNKKLSLLEISKLSKLLKNKSTRRYAAEILSYQKEFSEEVLLQLVELIKDKDEETKIYAARAIGSQISLSTDVLINLAKISEDYWVVDSAIEGINVQSILEIIKDKLDQPILPGLLRLFFLKCQQQRLALYFYEGVFYLGDKKQFELLDGCQKKITRTIKQIFTEFTGIPATIKNNAKQYLHHLDQTMQFQGDPTMENITSRSTDRIRETITLDIGAIKNAITLIDDLALQSKLIQSLEKSVKKATALNNHALNNEVFCQGRDAHIEILQEELKQITESDEYIEFDKTLAVKQILPDLIFPFWCCRPFLKTETEDERAQNIAKEQQLFNEQKAIRTQSIFIQALRKFKEDRETKQSRKPKVYFMYAWPAPDYAQRESGIQDFLGNLRQDLLYAGVEAIFDREDNFSGNNLHQFMGQILQDHAIVLVFGTESFRHKWFGHKTALQVEGELLKLRWFTDFSEGSIQPNQKTTIIPLVLTSIRETAIPEDLLPARNPTVRALSNLSYKNILSSILAVAYGITEPAVAKYINDIPDRIITIAPSKHSVPTHYSAIQQQTLFGRGIQQINHSNPHPDHTMASSVSLMEIEESNTNAPK